MTSFKAACVQMSATPDIEADIATDLALMEQAAAAGAQLIALPEYCAGLDVEDGALAPVAFPEAAHPALAAFSGFARDRAVELLIGSIAVSEPDRLVNRSFHIGRDGAVLARYDKIHMFDIDLGPDGRYCESDVIAPGTQATLTETHGARAGLSICYDLRFPHLYRDYARAGADILFIPAAFTRKTGAAHWHVLQRARAIENGAFVIAPGQCGTVAGGSEMFGHSLIVDPWGGVLADGGEEAGIVLAEIDLDRVAEARRKIPSLANERAYGKAAG
ncbi:MAG: carbon-nitrogen hydrolase family protein [Paracoccaceae bacterium]